MKGAFSAPVVEGVALRLRAVLPVDAAYIHELRLNPQYNRYLSEVTGTVADQRDWIKRYKEREVAGQEVYYIIERLDDGTPCGTVRIYDIEEHRFTWGSWILDNNKTPKAALESAVLIYDVGFHKLGLDRAVFDVLRDNENTLAFHHRFGAVETGAGDGDIFFEYPRARFEADRDEYMELLKKEVNV